MIGSHNSHRLPIFTTGILLTGAVYFVFGARPRLSPLLRIADCKAPIDMPTPRTVGNKAQSIYEPLPGFESDDFRTIKLAFTPDDKSLMISTDRRARLVDVLSGQTIRTFCGHRLYLHAAALSADGTLLATGSEDATVTLWDTKTGKLIRRMKGHSGKITDLSFSADGKHIVTSAEGSSCDQSNAIVWSVKVGENEAVLKGSSLPKGQVLHVAFAADGSQVILGMNSLEIVLWQFPKNGTRVLRHEGLPAGVNSTDGCSLSAAVHQNLLACASFDGRIAIWNTSQAKLVRDVGAAKIGAPGVCMSADGRLVLAGYVGNLAILWDAESGRSLHRFERSDWVSTVAFSHDQTKAALGEYDGTITIWDLKSFHLLEVIRIREGKSFRAPNGSRAKDGERRVDRREFKLNYCNRARADVSGAPFACGSRVWRCSPAKDVYPGDDAQTDRELPSRSRLLAFESLETRALIMRRA